jgi:hypothetical protein
VRQPNGFSGPPASDYERREMSDYVLWDQPREVEPPPEFRKLRNIMRLVWDYLGYNAPSKGQLLLADAIQDALLDPEMPADTIVRCPRNFGKSVILSCFPPMAWAWDPAATFFVTSAEPTKAKHFAEMSKNILEWLPELHHLRPGASQLDQSEQFNVRGHRGDQAPSMRATPVFSGWASNRAHWILGDDIENERTSDGPTMRAKLRNKLDSSTHLLTREGPRRRLLLGTAQVEESLYPWAEEERGFRTILIPATYPDKEYQDHLAHRLLPVIRRELDEDPSLVGTAIDPERLDLDVLAEKRASTTEADYLRQYEGDTRTGDAEDCPLKLRDLIVEDLSPTHAYPTYIWSASKRTIRTDLDDYMAGRAGDHYYGAMETEGTLRPYERVVTFIDPSGDGVDETAWCTCGLLNSRLFVLDIGGDPRGHGDEVLDAIIERALEYGSRLLVSESNWGGGMFTGLLAPAAKRASLEWKRKTGEEIHLGVDELQASTRQRKEQRIIESLLMLARSHRIIVDADAIRRDFQEPLVGYRPERGRDYRWAKQFSRATLAKGSIRHDDRLDALAMAATYFQDSLGADPNAKEAERIRKHSHRNYLWEAFGARPSNENTSGPIRRPLFLSPKAHKRQRATRWSSNGGPQS